MPTAFLRQSPLAVVENVGSASSEAGITVDVPQSDSGNDGALRLRAGGIPTTATALNVVLSRGGFPMGPRYTGSTTTTSPVPGAQFRWKNTTDSSSQWRGHTSHGFLTYAKCINVGSAANKYPYASELRTLSNGSLGFVQVRDGVTDIVRFCYKSSRTGSWSTAAMSPTSVDPDSKPGLIVLPTGRLVAYVLTTGSLVEALYSDDDGVTWATYATDCRVSAGDGKSIHAEAVGDAVAIAVAGTPQTGSTNTLVFWSLDGGQTFSRTDTKTGSRCRTVVDATGRLIVFVAATGVVSSYPVAVGGGYGTALVSSMVTLNTTVPLFTVTLADDGAIWFFSADSSYQAAALLNARYSPDNGVNYYPLRDSNVGADEVFDNKAGGSNYGWKEMVLGSWQGMLVMVAVSEGATANQDGGQYELQWGGYDSLTEYPVDSATDTLQSNFYEKGVYVAADTPDSYGVWTKTDVGGGATVTVDDDGLNLVSTLGNSSYYTAGATIFNPSAGDCVRVRFLFRVNSNGSVTTNCATVQISISDTANRQFIILRFSTDAMALVDNSGTLQTSATVANQFQSWTEVLVSFAHDTPAAGGGTVSVWYRITGSTHWTALASNQAVAELAASATEHLIFGGSAGFAADWDIMLLAAGDGAGSLHDGFTNPDHLVGRGLSSSTKCVVTNGITLGAFGGPGILADAYTVRSTYQFAATNIWKSVRPGCHWRSAADNATTTLVFGDASNVLVSDMVAVFGTNVPEITFQFNATDSWGAPSYATKASAVVWAGVSTSEAVGFFKVDGEPLIPHAHRSASGHRWYVEIGATPGTLKEITDNDASRIYVEDLDCTSFPGAALRIFCDRMAVTYPAQSYLYVRQSIAAYQASENYFREGTFYIGVRHDLAIAYDNGFVDRYPAASEVYTGIAGYDTSARLGPEKHELRIAWAMIDRLTTPELTKLVALFRSLEGEHRPIALWRDTSDPSSLGLYRVQGPTSKENVYGEGADELARLAQYVLVEVVP